jgi:hypothetical protein
MYVMCFPLHCPWPGYWLLSGRVVPPPQSDHCKQLLSGESPHPIRHEKEHHIINISHTKVNLYIHAYILIIIGRKTSTGYVDHHTIQLIIHISIYLLRTSLLDSIAAPLSRRNCRTATWPSCAAILRDVAPPLQKDRDKKTCSYILKHEC